MIGDEAGDSRTEERSMSTGKRRKYTPNVTNALATVMEKNREKVVLAMTEGEDRADTRHKELLELEGRKHDEQMAIQRAALQLEKEKLESNKAAAAGYIGALQAIGNAMALVGASLNNNR